MNNESLSQTPSSDSHPGTESKLNYLDSIDDSVAKNMLQSMVQGLHSTSVLACTTGGMILFANNIATFGFPKHSREQIIGGNLIDLAPEQWAKERIKLINLAANRNRPLMITEILVGTRLISTLTPCKINNNDNSEIIVIVTVEKLSPMMLQWLRSNTNPDDLIDAKYIDLGQLAVLTSRELEILAYMGQGLRQKQIAERLHRSVSTIDRHRERIGEKLGITDRIELVGLAREAALEVSDAKRINTPLGHTRFSPK